MTAIISRPHRARAVSHRLLLTLVAFAIALAAVATIAVNALTSSDSAASFTRTVPPPAEEQTDMQRACQLARVPECSWPN